MKKNKGPRILVYDIETSPLLSNCWGLFDQNIPLNQVEREWFVLSFSAKWLGDPASKIIYYDQRNSKNIEDDRKLLKKIWTLLDECDIALTQNGVRFDNKKLNARFIMNGMQPPSSYKNIDTLKIAKKHFAFTSNKLEWMSEKLCTKFKKLKHKKYPGFSLWSECLKGNKEAFKEMETYNKHDVLALEELYEKLRPWDNSTINFNVYNNDYHHTCACGGINLIKRGFFFSPTGKFQRWRCKDCGAESRDGKNMLDKEKRDSLKKNTTR